MPRKRLTREERRAATRTDLLDAASRVFARQGFHAATLDDVAREAGYTTGAIYSNFGGKEDLFLSAFEEQIARHIREVTEAVSGAGDDETARIAERILAEERAAAGAIAAHWDDAVDASLEAKDLASAG